MVIILDKKATPEQIEQAREIYDNYIKTVIDIEKEFLDHAEKDFEKAKLTERETGIRNEIKKLANNLDALSNPHLRLRWTEDIMTARCRL